MRKTLALFVSLIPSAALAEFPTIVTCKASSWSGYSFFAGFDGKKSEYEDDTIKYGDVTFLFDPEKMTVVYTDEYGSKILDFVDTGERTIIHPNDVRLPIKDTVYNNGFVVRQFSRNFAGITAYTFYKQCITVE